MNTSLTNNIHEALAIHEALRRIGYPAEDIFINPEEEQNSLNVVAKDGDKMFTVAVGKLNCPLPMFSALWEQSIHWWNDPQNKVEVNQIYEKSHVKSEAVELLLALVVKGMKVNGSQAGKSPVQRIPSNLGLSVAKTKTAI